MAMNNSGSDKPQATPASAAEQRGADSGLRGPTLRLRSLSTLAGAEAPQDQQEARTAQQQERAKTMPADKPQNVQDVFLNHIRKNKVPVTIFLINGVKLQGVVSSFDNFCLLLRRDGHVQLVYKHAVSTVMPSTIVKLYEPGEAETETE
jgi:host factor-I protein